MKSNSLKIKEKYDLKYKEYHRLEEEANFILESALEYSGIKLHSITHRVKEFKSFLEKIERKQYSNPFEQMKDIVGLRIVCLFLSDIPKIEKILQQAFNVMEIDNKIDIDTPQMFGYMDIKYIVTLKAEHKGPRYDAIKGLKFEIQLCTLSMHSWATISHYLDYKQDRDIPTELKRDFYALSGLFYVVDKHFEMFYQTRRKSQSKIADNIEKFEVQFDQEINLDSLQAYLLKRFPHRHHADIANLSELIKEIDIAGFKTIGDIENMVCIALDAFLAFEKDRHPDNVGFYADVGVIRGLLGITNKKYREFRHVSDQYDKYLKLVKQN